MENYSGRWGHTQLSVYSSVGEGKFDMIVFSCIMFQNTQHSAKIIMGEIGMIKLQDTSSNYQREPISLQH